MFYNEPHYPTHFERFRIATGMYDKKMTAIIRDCFGRIGENAKKALQSHDVEKNEKEHQN